jgi:hypothetical protein
MPAKPIRTSKKYEALTALAEIRDWLREFVVVPPAIVADFNTVAKRLGAESDWMRD